MLTEHILLLIFILVVVGGNANNSIYLHCVWATGVLTSCSFFSLTGRPEETSPGEHQRQTLERPDEQTDATDRTRRYVPSADHALCDVTAFKELEFE